MGYIMFMEMFFGLFIAAVAVTKYFKIDLVSWFIKDEIS